MAQPTPYTRQTNFSDFSALSPTAPHSGPLMDAEMEAVRATLIGVLANLALIQRDDGKLANTSVNLEQLGTGVLALFASSAGWKPRGLWLTATAYVVGDFVASGTGSYVCAVAHIGGVFATDKAAGKWILLFDTAGVTPGDGSVTTAKLVDGSITTPKIGFTGLDLPGNGRFGNGVQAGTAPFGSLMHAQRASGDVLIKAERSSLAQGAVGYQWLGFSNRWTLACPAGSGDLVLDRDGTVRATFTGGGALDYAGPMRIIGGGSPTVGAGVGLTFASRTGTVTSYDYDAVAWRDLKLRGLVVYLTAGGVDVLAVNSLGVDVAGYLKINGISAGYLGIPSDPQSTAYTLAAAGAGKDIYSENVAGQTIFVPTNAAVPLDEGYSRSITNDGTTSITVDTTGVVVRLAGTGTVTGNRTIAAGGQALLRKVKSPDRWWIGGVGVS